MREMPPASIATRLIEASACLQYRQGRSLISRRIIRLICKLRDELHNVLHRKARVHLEL